MLHIEFGEDASLGVGSSMGKVGEMTATGKGWLWWR